EYTEAEYREMSVEKLKEEIIENFNNNEIYILGHKSLGEDFHIVSINKENGKIYGYGNTSIDSPNQFIVADLNSDLFKNCVNYEQSWNAIKDADGLVSMVKAKGNIHNQITDDTYNDFLNSVVTDSNFKTLLSNSGIEISNEAQDWEDVATLVNASYFDNQTIEIKFVNINNNKTVALRVSAYLTLQESSSMQSMIETIINRSKTYEIEGEIEDYQEFEINLLENNQNLNQ
ncbi:MAG: hypothetical protein PHS54_04345, partial [Clostridia bacterium]|nr:hypothetical protein [Clostridia bacterium]